MEGEGEGMVAVVRGLRDAGLAITLLDGDRQYTLIPNNDNNGSSHLPVKQTQSPTRVQITQHASARSQTHESCAHRSESGAQATDGRYASMYKTTHCRVTPTSPVPLLPEFPPQRAELCPGHGNFEVGGPGSGENYTPCKSGGSFRGAMSWPDRGSVCSPRPSREPDAFANSLRKYPSISIERSTEMVERLITYTQAKNISKSYQNRSPPRHGSESNSSNHIVMDRNNSRNSVPRSGYYQKSYYEPEVTSNRAKPRIDESPTSLRSDCDCVDYRKSMMRADKYYKEMSRKVKENMRNLSSYPYNQPMLSPVTRDRSEHNNKFNGQRTSSVLTATNSVNIEVQAATKMVSKEVATVPRTDYNQRTVAVPLSPTSSNEEHKVEGDVSDLTTLNVNTPTHKSVETVTIDDHKAEGDIRVSDQRHAKRSLNTPTYKSIETGSMPVDLSVQTTSSVVYIANNLNHIHNDRCFNIKRRSKSTENFYKDFSEEIFELLKKVSVCPNSDPQSCLLRREVLRQMSKKLKKMTENMNFHEGIDNTKDQIGQMLKYVPIWEPCGDVQAYRDAISDEIINRMKRHRTINVYRAETRYGISDEEIIDVVLKNWLSNIRLKSFDVNGNPANHNKITQTFVNRLKQLILSKSINDGSNAMKLEICRIISELPLEVQDYHKTEYLHNLTESLLQNLSSYTFMNFSSGGCTPVFGSTNQKGRKKIINKRFENYIQPTEAEIRDCITDEVKQFLDKNCSSSNSVDIKEVEIEIIDYLIDSIQAIRTGEDYIESELTMLLCQDIDSISWSDAKEVAQRFLKLVGDMFSSNSCQKGIRSYQSQSYVVQNAATHSYSRSNNNEDSQNNNFSIEQISKKDIDANLDAYMNQLTAQIDEWLANPEMQIPQSHDSGFRQVVVHDLAGDIIDRHIYLELSPSSRGSDADELEYLKYQIFKWINKLAGEDNMETISHAPELMRRIQSIPVPMLTIPNVNTSMSRRQSFNRHHVLPMYVDERRRSLNQTLPPDISAANCSSANPKPISPSVKKLNDEYDEFLKNWVQEIPIKTSSPAEQELADKARLGIYNGIWKAITKLKCEPAIFNNQFYYEDSLDDELEELLSALPKTPELDSKKHLLKIRLIEKTTNTNQLIKSIAAPASFKQQLVDNVSNSLLHMTANKEAPIHSNEERQIQKIVDDYILCANYKEFDTAKANIYRKKLIQEARTLLDKLKKTLGKELKDIDTDVYLNNIFNALHKVPLPNEAVVKDEAIEILLGNEVEQWMLDIPVAPNGDEQQQRKTLKDALVKRIIEIEKQVNIFDCSGEKVLKHEIASFLESVPLKQGEKLNTTFMIEELVNRMKNRSQEMQAGNGADDSGAFMDSAGYYEFSQQMPFCSSFSEIPGARPAVRNQSSFMIRDGTRVKEHEYNYFTEPTPPPHVPLPSEEYFTMYENTPPKKQPPVQHQYSKHQSYKTIPPETIHQTINQSLAPSIQPYLDTARDRTIPPPTTAAEIQQNPCCRSGTVNLTPQQVSQIINQSGQLRNSKADQLRQVLLNEPPQALAGNVTQEPETFMDSAGYYEFSQKMPFCSSFSESPGVRPAVRNQSSFMIRDGTRVKEHEYNYFTEPTPPPHVPLPSEEYFTMYENTPPKRQPPIQQPSGQQLNQFSKLQSYKTIPPDTIHRTINQSIPPYVQPSHITVRDKTVPPPTPAAEIQQNPCCRSAAVNLTPQQVSQMINQSGQLRNSKADQLRQVQFNNPLQTLPPCCVSGQVNTSRVFSQSMNQSGQPNLSNVRVDQFLQVQFDVPPPVLPSCCYTKQGNTSRVVTPQDRVGTPVRTSYPEPIAVSQSPQAARRSSIAYPQTQAAEQQQQVQGVDAPQSKSFRGQQDQVTAVDPRQSLSLRGAGQQQQAGAVVPQLGSFQQAQATRRASQPRPVPGQMSTYGEPRYFSTPQQVIAPPQESPPRPGRKKTRGPQRNKRNLERRRLDLEDDKEGFESEEDESCHCLQRMMRRRRPPMCYPYEDFEMDQYYPFPHGSHRLVTNNFTVKLCGDVHVGGRSVNQTHNIEDHKNIKSVQTSFSSVDLVPTRKCQNCNRKIKSQEDLRNLDRDIQLENEVIDWLRENCNGEVTSKWGEKMQRLAQKINKPGGEEKIRQKIQKYLRRVPNQCSESDDERRSFREQLPDSIVKKLRKMCSKPERKRSHTPSVRIFRIEIPKEYYDIEDEFRAIVKNWMKDIPIKKRDFLGRSIKKDDVIDSVAFQLKPYILNKENYDKDYRSTLKSIIEEILIEMPLEMNSSDNPSYYNRLALTLLNNIIHLYNNEHSNETSNSNAPKNHQQESKLRDFILNEITNILNKVHLSASTKRLILLEEELKEVLEIIEKNGYVIDDTTKDTVFTVLNKLGGLSDYQANYYTDVILQHFKEFHVKSLRIISSRDSKDKHANTEVSCNDTYSIFHNSAEIKYLQATNRKPVKNNKDLTINDEIKSSTVFYKRRVIVQIEDWLNELHVGIPSENRDKAVRELAEDIIDRYMYLEMNPKSQETDESELQYLKYQIFKWINKVAGEKTMETIERANELMERIKCIETPNSFKLNEEKNKSPVAHKILSLNISQLKHLIVDCLNDIPNVFEDVTNESEIIDDLAFNLSRQIKTNAIIDDVIDKEVGRWTQKVYKGKYQRVIKHKLIQLLKNILGSRNSLNSKTEKLMIRKYEDLIDDSIDDFAKTSKEIIDIDDRNKHTHELAMRLFDLVNGDEIVTSTYLETVALKWATTFIGKQTIRREWASKLIDSILDYNNEALSEKNHQESGTNKFQTNNGSNPILQSNEEQLVRRANDIAVYGVTLPSNPKAGNRSVVDSSINEITDDDIEANIDLYLKQLVEQIDSWLGTLNIPQIHDKGFREIVINDLAGDIIDRHKYLELNPSIRGSDESEVEQLKYQIFKWINKLVGEDQSETVEHAPELMNRIRSIPVPMMSKPLNKSKKGNNNMTNRSEITKTSANPSNVRLSNPLGFTTGPMAATNKNVTQMPLQRARGSLPTNTNVNLTNKRLSGPPVLGIPKTPTRPEEPKNLQDCKTVEEVYQYFDVVFQERVKEIPLETPTPEQKYLAELARKGLYNGIWKTFLHLRADPQIDNDYSYFEMAFEDELDNMLDCIPQTGEIQKIRHTWKIKVLCDVIGMLKYIHSITDSPSFRQALTQKFNRRYLREKAQQKSDYLQQLHIASIAKEYILMTKYKTEDSVKAEAYRQRLMKKVNEFAETIKREANVDYVSINRAQFTQMAMKLLASVPIPHDEILKDEAEEILITEEVDQWYNGLPVQPLKNETDDALRKRMRELLARKLLEIEKRLDLDESAEYDMKHEVLKFLEERAELQPTESIRLDFMVEELMNRLKNRRDQKKLGYESFERENPLSSTFAQTDRGEVLAPLMDAGINADAISPYDNQMAGPSHQSHLYKGQGVSTNEVYGPNSHLLSQRRMSQSPASHQGQGVLRTSQAGPSVQELIQRHQTLPPCCQGQDVSYSNQIPGPNSQVLSQRRMSQPPTHQGQGVFDTSQVAGPSVQEVIQQMNQSVPPCCRRQSILGTSQVAGPSGLGYQQPIDPQPHQSLRTSQEPNQGIASERSGNQSYHAPSVQATDRSQYPSNAEPYANLPSSQMGAQIHPDSVPGSGQASSNAPVNTDFSTTQGATRSTARVVSPAREETDEDTDGGEEIHYKCRCMKRSWKCKRRRFYEDRPYCYPTPFPCRYFY